MRSIRNITDLSGTPHLSTITRWVGFLPILFMTTSAVTGIPRFATFGIILFAVISILEGKLFTRYGTRDVIILGGLAFLVALWSLASFADASALKKLEKYLSTILIPLFFIKGRFSNNDLLRILKLYCFTVFAIFLLSISVAFYNYLYKTHPYGQLEFFFYTDLSYSVVGAHPLYLSLAGSIACLVALKVIESAAIRWLYILSITIILILLNARMILVTHCVIMVAAIIGTIITERKYYLLCILIGGVVMTFVIGGKVAELHLKPNRSVLINFQQSIERSSQPDISSSDNGLTVRLAVWEAAFDLIKKNPWLGIGPTNETEHLVQIYENEQQRYLMEEKYNCHNQYLSFLVSFGCIGGVALIIIYIMQLGPLITTNGPYRGVFLLFIILISTAMLTESILNRFHGLTLIAYINTLFYLLAKK